MDPVMERWRRLALDQMDRGQLAQAVESWRQLLGLDPEDGEGHAGLALCLLNFRRLQAARAEAALALAFEPESLFALHASAATALAARKFKEAEEQLERLRDMAPETPQVYRSLASLYDLTGRRAEGKPMLERALALDPEHPGILSDLGAWYLDQGDLVEAESWARKALETVSEHPGSLVLMGNVLLRRGQFEAAREHAVWALRNEPDHRGALHLMAAVKARSNFFLGLWWRWSVWMGSLGEGRAIAVLLGAFVIYRIAHIATSTAADPDIQRFAELVQFLWLALVAYTWIGPGLFRRALMNELRTVKLDPSF